MDFANTSGIKSPFSPRVRQAISGRRSIGLSSAKKNQSKYVQDVPTGEIIYKTPLCTITSYGTPLPVMVTEALTFGSGGSVSVRMSSCGWCWLVSGRRVLCWPGVAPPATAAAAAAPAAARELTLPQTDLAHKADLVVLFYEDGAQMPSCIGVSPEGTVRYWRSVATGAYSDTCVELAGQECDRLTEPCTPRDPRTPRPARRRRLLLATTTCTAVMLTTQIIEGRGSVSARVLRPPSGWLGGLGRRVSLLFFGATPAAADTKLVNIVLLPADEGGEGCEAEEEEAGEGYEAEDAGEGEGGGGRVGAALLTSAGVLQLWRDELSEHDLRQLLTAKQPGLSQPLELAALDMVSWEGGVLLLLAAPPPDPAEPSLRYAIAHISLGWKAEPRVTSWRWWRGAGWGRGRGPRLLPHPRRHAIYTSHYVATVPNKQSECLEVCSLGGGGGGGGAGGDRVVGAARCGGRVLVFTAAHGLALLTYNDDAHAQSVSESPAGSPCPSDMYEGNLTLYEIDPHEVSMSAADACGRLKSAFLFHLRRERAACDDILEELFPSPTGPTTPTTPTSPTSPTSAGDVDHPLDRTVIKIATEILDDVPNGDPRWKVSAGGGGGQGETGGTATTCRIPLGSSGALQVSAQLRDKQRALELFLGFLQDARLLDRLGLVTALSDNGGGGGGGGGAGDGCVSSRAVLVGLVERVAAARALRRLQHAAHAHVIDAPLHQMIAGAGAGGGADADDMSDEEPEVMAAVKAGVLSAAEACFRRVSRVQRVLQRVCSCVHAAPHHQLQQLQAVTSCLSEMLSARATWSSPQRLACPPLPSPRRAAAAARGLLQRSVLEYGAECTDQCTQAQIYELSAKLADLLLTDAEPLLQSTYTEDQYYRLRRDLIQPFVSVGQKERAETLSEKFRDLQLLAELALPDAHKLYHYIDKYADQGMAELTFAQLFEEGASSRARLVQLAAQAPSPAGDALRRRLARWLDAAECRAPALAQLHLAWGSPLAAARVLARLARAETASVDRMTTMASLSKLCLLASGQTERGEVEGEEAGEGTVEGVESLLQQVEEVLTLSAQHAALPRHIRIRHGLDAADCRVHHPEELVQMYVESGGESLNEYDYKKALDLTDALDDTLHRDELRLRVWCASIKHDSWSADTQTQATEPRAALRDKMFFRLVDLVHLMGGDLEVMLPPLEDILTAPELAELVSDPRAQFLLKYGYECLEARRGVAAADD